MKVPKDLYVYYFEECLLEIVQPPSACPTFLHAPPLRKFFSDNLPPPKKKKRSTCYFNELNYVFKQISSQKNESQFVIS